MAVVFGRRGEKGANSTQHTSLRSPRLMWGNRSGGCPSDQRRSLRPCRDISPKLRWPLCACLHVCGWNAARKSDLLCEEMPSIIINWKYSDFTFLSCEENMVSDFFLLKPCITPSYLADGKICESIDHKKTRSPHTVFCATANIR